jgi:hypothetical protein
MVSLPSTVSEYSDLTFRVAITLIIIIIIIITIIFAEQKVTWHKFGRHHNVALAHAFFNMSVI